MAEIQDNEDGYVSGRDVGLQQMRRGTTEMGKLVRRMATDWLNINSKRLTT